MCTKENIEVARSIDIHTHILPEKMPKWSEKFGYGGFVSLDHHKTGCARMMIDDVFFREIESNCWDGNARLTQMNQWSNDVQVLSTVPVMFNYHINANHSYDIQRFLNDHIAETVAKHPSRFIGIGSIPMQDAALSVKELERCVTELGMPGIQIGTNINDENLSEEKFNLIWEAAERLNACIFVHPWNMMGQGSMKKYWLPWLVGMPAESSRAICSLIFGGVFSRYPKLRFAFAHGGGSFPFTVGRVQHGFDVRPDLCAIDNQIRPEDFCGHFWVDSLVHSPNALAYNLKLFGEDKIAIGSDYPFPLGEDIPGELIKSMKLQKSIEDKLMYQNAMKWLWG